MLLKVSHIKKSTGRESKKQINRLSNLSLKTRLPLQPHWGCWREGVVGFSYPFYVCDPLAAGGVEGLGGVGDGEGDTEGDVDAEPEELSEDKIS